MSLKQDLIAARALIAEPAQWTTLASARLANGTSCSPWDVGAVCFCMFGTVDRVAKPSPTDPTPHPTTNITDRLTQALDDALLPEFDGWTLDEFNDDPNTTHEMVLAVYDRAIEAAQ
jgi:hypothetical protein